MAFDHKPVMPREAIEALAIKPGGVYVDGTLGGGGHAKLMLQQLAESRSNSGSRAGTLIGIDKDEDAIKAAKERLNVYESEKLFIKSDFHDIKSIMEELGQDEIDGALLDLGVSSYQLDEAERGFSYMQDASLDMRMDQNQSFSAKDVLNGYGEQELARVIKEYGEERWAKRIAAFVVDARAEKPIETTGELVEVIKKAIPASARRDGPHPAKRTFQAIRIEVNGELAGLDAAIDDFIDILAPGGRLAVISFHSLEDRIAKETIARRADPCTCPPEIPVCVCGKIADIKKVTKKPLLPSDHEIAANPRSRSAKLRVVEKI